MDSSGAGGERSSAERSQSSSSSASSQHAALLSTVLELRGDMEKAVSKMSKMEEQNQALAANYSLLKEELLDTRRKYNESRENYLAVVEEKIELERSHEEFIEKIKVQLAEKTKEFESLRDKFAPQDIDFVRIKVQEELEIPHRQKLQAMDKEVQKYKEEFFSMRRELEKNKAEYEAYSQNQQREVSSIREEHQGIQLILRDQILKLQESSNSSDKDEQLRQKTMKIYELQRMHDEAREEARVLANDKETLSASLAQVRIKTDEAVERLRDKALVAEAAKQGAEERLSHAVTEGDRKDTIMRAARQAQEEMSTQLDHARRQLVASEAALLTLRSDHVKEIEDNSKAFQAERASLLEQLDGLTVKLHAALDLQRRAQRETAEVQVRSEAQESETRRSYLAQTQLLQRRLGLLELEGADAAALARAADEAREAAASSSTAELDVLRSELGRLKREKDTLHDRCRELEHVCEGERRKSAALKREQASRKEYLDLDLRDERNKLSAAEGEVMMSKIREAELASQKADLERRVAEQAQTIESLTLEAKARLTTITGASPPPPFTLPFPPFSSTHHSPPQHQHQHRPACASTAAYQDKVQQMKSKLKAALSAERKRSEAYKGKALQAHTRGKEILALHARENTLSD